MDAIPPIIEEPARINRKRWWVHLALIVAYILIIAIAGASRHKRTHAVMSGSSKGLLIVCGVELLIFGVVFGLACFASRITREELLLTWRKNILPVIFGAAYSIGLRIAILIVVMVVAIFALASQLVSSESLRGFAEKNRPDIESLIDVNAMSQNPVYFWLTLTVASFIVAGLREELWRSAFLAGMRKLWPGLFDSTAGQVRAILIISVFFGSAHIYMGILATVFAGLLGIGLGLIMVFHKSIWPAVIAHGFFDATTFALIPWMHHATHHMQNH